VSASRPPDLDDLRAQRDAGRFGAGGPFGNSGFNTGCNGCVMLGMMVTAMVAAVLVAVLS
jgi:hypothetical protein